MEGSVRTCIGCRRVASPPDLVRVTRTADGRLTVSGPPTGRGAWLCRGTDELVATGCMDEAVRRRAFARAFRAPVDEAAIEALRADVLKRARIEGGRG